MKGHHTPACIRLEIKAAVYQHLPEMVCPDCGGVCYYQATFFEHQVMEFCFLSLPNAFVCNRCKQVFFKPEVANEIREVLGFQVRLRTSDQLTQAYLAKD